MSGFFTTIVEYQKETLDFPAVGVVQVPHVEANAKIDKWW